MLTLKPISFLTSARAVREAVDQLHSLIEQRKKLEAEEDLIKERLKEISLKRGETTIPGFKFQAQVVTEWQQRVNTSKLKASLLPAEFASLTKTTKVVKVLISPIAEPTAQAAE